MLYELFLKNDFVSGNEPKIKRSINAARKKYNQEIQKFDLWIEFLKRSENYKNVCTWFSEAKKEYPYPDKLAGGYNHIGYILDYLVFVKTYDHYKAGMPFFPLKTLFGFVHVASFQDDRYAPINDMLSNSFFDWAFKAGFPTKDLEIELLMNLLVFGNIHEDPSQASLLRTIHLIQRRRTVYSVHEILDTVFHQIERDERYLNGRHPTLEEFKSALKRFFGHDVVMSFCLLDPSENFQNVEIEIKENILRKRAEIKRNSKAKSADKSFLEFDQFEWPTSNFHFETVKRYLKVYDLSKSGKTNREVAKIIFAKNYNDDKIDTLKRQIMRDKRFAEKIIKNVEKGFFPGRYQDKQN